MGAGKWDPAYTKQLEDAHDVVIIADDDEPGIAHARDVAASLEGHVDAVVIMRSPHAKDVFEHFEKGLGIDDFVPLEDEDKGAHGDSKILLAGLHRHRYATHAVAVSGPYPAWMHDPRCRWRRYRQVNGRG